MTVRCRFAPSPTGSLHVGGARTALINWLFARHEGGEFVLRIEDTDVSRSKAEFTEAILAGLRWLGIDWDGEPVFQSRRMDRYREAAERLLSEGRAYRCSCTAEEIDAMRERAKAAGEKPKYDGRCRERAEHPAERPLVVRFRFPDDGETVVDDVILGKVTFDNRELDDLVIMRSDGTPTYNFAAVVDDHDLSITHVIRGNDHLNNTPRQMRIYEALGWAPPRFAHHPLILGEDKSKMSKRHGATSLISYQEMGYLPEAVMNFLARIGWSRGDQEVFSREELIEYFKLEDLGKSPGVWNPEKLNWLNGHYIRSTDVDRLAGLAAPFFLERGREVEPDERFKRIVELHRERVKTLAEYPDAASYYFGEGVEFEEKAARKFLKPENREVLEKARARLASLDEFDEGSIESAFAEVMEETDKKLGKIAQPVRVAVTGGTVSPGIFEMLAVMGKDRVLKRLDTAIAMCDEAGE